MPANTQRSVLAIIPARGGSRGIPRKNIQRIAGKPLLAFTIEHARQTPAVTRVVVSTDDPEIAAVAQAWDADVVWRPAEISGDTASSESALVHALRHLQREEGYAPELVVFLQATSPLRRPDDIANAIALLQKEAADSLFSACSVHGFVWRKKDDQLASITYDHLHRPRRQDVGEDLLENGSIYVFKPWVLHEFNNRLGGKIAVYRMHPLDSFQVDEPADLELMEKLLALRPAPAGPLPVRLLVLDFDGVLTDNRVLVSQQGIEAVWCHRGDGWGIARLRDAGLEVVVLSTETNPVVGARCTKLGIACEQACADKLTALQRLAEQRGLAPHEIAFMGNDVNDLACLRWVGLPLAPADAVPEVRAAARLVTANPGGHGAVREAADFLLLRPERWTDARLSAGGEKTMKRKLNIGGHLVGEGEPAFIVAEIGINHNGSLETARRLIDAACLAGCDAVKFQKRTPELCVPAEQRDLPRETPWGVMSYLEYRYRVEFGVEEYDAIDRYCRERKIAWFASPWDEPSVDFLERYEPVCHKIPSAALTDHALLRRLRATGRPLILSTGMSTLEQIRAAVKVLGPEDLLIAHCTSTYPCKPEELNLRVIRTLQREFNCPVGYSGHEVGLQTSLAAVVLGACFIERHLTLDRTLWGSDQAASVEPHGFARLVRDIRVIEKALGDGVKRVFESEMAVMKRLRRVER